MGTVLGVATALATLLRFRARASVVLACVAAMLCATTSASALERVQTRTRIRDFSFALPLNVWLERCAYDTSNRLTQLDELGADGPYTLTYSYDNNGNTLTKEKSDDPSATTTFEYDSRDQLVQVTRGPPGSEQVEGQYDYDANGLRVRVRGGSRGDVDYYYDGGAVIEERSAADDSLVARYHYADRALRMDDYSGGSAKPLYYHHDALGTPTHLTRPDGSIAQQYKLDPWGRPRSGVAGAGNVLASANRKLFTGHEYDPNTGLYYAKARYYDPDQGRFLTQDAYLGEPGVPPSLHRYLYAASNPARYVDPTGHVYVTEDGEAIRSPEEALLPADALQWSKADFEMADSETRYFCTRVDGYRSCGIWTPGSDGGRAETAESRTGESTVVLRAPSELKSSRTLLQEELARAYRTRVRSRRAERSEAYWHGTADSVLGIGKVLSDWGVLFANVFAPEWEDEEGTLRRTTDHGVLWNSLASVREGSSRWSSWWEQTVMFGRPSAPLLALSYDEGVRGVDAALLAGSFGGTGAVRSLGTVATGRVSSTVARTSRAMLVGGRATRGPPLPNAALRPGVALEDAWAGSVGAARARSLVVERPVPTPRTILGNEVGAPLVRESTAAGAGAEVAQQGFRSFSALKRALGPAGPGKHWHHIVEQTKGNVGRFGAETIHNTQNVVALDAAVHRQISAYYSRIQPFTGGQTVRQWLSTQPLEAQRQFGLQVLRDFGGLP